MAKTKNSKKGKGSYAVYKTENRAYNNKVSKFKRIVKQFPNDKEANKTLERLLKGPANFKHKQRPHVAGSNPTVPKRKYFNIPHVETPAEQLSRLLGIPMPKKNLRRRRKAKASVTVKKKKT